MVYNINDRIAVILNNGEHPDREFIEVYTALRIKLGYFPLLEGQEGFVDILSKFAGFTIKSYGHGLSTVSNNVFNSISRSSKKSLDQYKARLGIWKETVFKNARSVDGNKFDNYVVRIVPYKVLKDRVNAVLTIHQALENVKGIMNAPVKYDNYWLTNECQEAIDAMTKIGFNARNYNMLDNSVSSAYKKAEVKQAIFLHRYTLNNMMKLFNYVDKIAEYASPKYINEYKNKFEDCTDKLDETEVTILEKEMDDPEEKNTKKINKDKYELAMRSSRMWWIIHFIRSAYLVTTDIFSTMELLAKISGKCLAR